MIKKIYILADKILLKENWCYFFISFICLQTFQKIHIIAPLLIISSKITAVHNDSTSPLFYL